MARKAGDFPYEQRPTRARFTSLERGEPWEWEYRLRGADGDYRWFLARAEPVRDPDTGVITQWVGTATDIASRRQALLVQVLLGLGEECRGELLRSAR